MMPPVRPPRLAPHSNDSLTLIGLPEPDRRRWASVGIYGLRGQQVLEGQAVV